MNIKTRLGASSFVAAFAFAALAFGCACPKRSGTSSDSSEESAQVERRLNAVLAAAESKDFVHLDSYHLYGPKFTKFTGSSPVRLDATAGRNGEHKGLAATNGLKMRADDLKIDVFGDVAIATFILDYSFTSGNEKTRRQERTTLVLVKDGGEWKITHEHLSPIPQA